MRLRCWGVLIAVVALAWAGSVFTPWADDLAPRLWLYDVVFYLRFVVLGWWLVETARLLFSRARPVGALLPLGLAALVAVLAFAGEHTGPGLRLRVLASGDALEVIAAVGEGRDRQRAGYLLVDAVSRPCSAREPWLWLGRPHGGGTGTSIALVRGDGGVPLAPAGDAHRFRHAGGPWWMAYQHAARYAAASAGECRPGAVLQRHGQGLEFVEDGWAEHR